MKKRSLLFLLFFMGQGPMLLAQGISGRFVTSFYGWEQRTSTSSDSARTQFRGYETVQLDFGTSDLSFHTYLQGSTDLQNAMKADPQLRLFNAYLSLKNFASMMDVKLGRIPVFSGVSTGSIDGAMVRARATDGIEIMAYGGGLPGAAQKAEFFTDIERNWQLGGQALLYLIPDTKIGLSYMNRHRQTTAFDRRYFDPASGVDVVTHIDYGSRANQYGSLNVAYSKSDLWLFGRYDYDFNFERTGRVELAANYQLMPTLGLSLNLAHREPMISYNSYFAFLETEANQEAVLGIDYMVHPWMTVMGRFSTVMYNDDNAFRVSLGGANKYGSIMYTKDVSYDGDLDGFDFQVSYPCMSGMLVPHIGATYSTYALAENLDRTSTWVGVIGAMYRPWKKLSCDVQGQYMANKIYTSDMRVFLRLNYWFAHTFGIGE